MKLVLDNIVIQLGAWNLAADGIFHEGIHIVSGDVGSGKSTLALMMAGLFTPVSGSAVRDQISSLMISFQFPEYHLTGMTVGEECASWGLDPDAVLLSADLAEKCDCDPFSLSRGELKRLHLACVLAHPYDLLILDEPFSSLDVCEKERVCKLMSARTRGITILFTHEQATLPRVGKIWEIEDGRLICCGTIPDGIRHWKHAPSVIRSLVTAGKVPANISTEDILEAVCRMSD